VSKDSWSDSVEERESQDRIRTMDKDFRLDAYRETYTNFRHFDTLRWRVPGIASLVGGALLSFGRRPNELPIPGALFAYGSFALLCAFVMHRIGLALQRNNEVLRRYALSFGDYSIPPRFPWWRSAARWIEIFLAIIGVLSLALACDLFGWLAVHLR
jgi:hypothetical protein